MSEPTEREWLEGLRYEDKFPERAVPPADRQGGEAAEIERDELRAENERLVALVASFIDGLPEPAAKEWRASLNAAVYYPRARSSGSAAQNHECPTCGGQGTYVDRYNEVRDCSSCSPQDEDHEAGWACPTCGGSNGHFLACSAFPAALSRCPAPERDTEAEEAAWERGHKAGIEFERAHSERDTERLVEALRWIVDSWDNPAPAARQDVRYQEAVRRARAALAEFDSGRTA